jgi:hypothetical protein
MTCIKLQKDALRELVRSNRSEKIVIATKIIASGWGGEPVGSPYGFHSWKLQQLTSPPSLGESWQHKVNNARV